MARIQRIPWDIQPPVGARVVERHPSQMWWMPHTGLIGSRFDRVPVQDVRTQRGVGLAGQSANIASTLGNGIIYLPPSATGSWTLFVMYHHTGIGMLNNQAFTGVYDNGATSYFEIVNEGGGANISTTATSSSNWTSVTGPSAQSYKLYSAVATLTAGVGQALCINGQVIGVNLVARTPANLDRWCIGFNGAENGKPHNGPIFLAGVINDAIPLEEARKASENLWAYAFEPRSVYMPFTAAASSFNAAWARNSNQVIGTGSYVS
jgi:hypothetical protein